MNGVSVQSDASLRLRYIRMPKDKREEIRMAFDDDINKICWEGMSEEEREKVLNEAMERSILKVEIDGEMEFDLDDIPDAEPCRAVGRAFLAEDKWNRNETMDRLSSRIELESEIEHSLADDFEFEDFDLRMNDKEELGMPLYYDDNEDRFVEEEDDEKAEDKVDEEDETEEDDEDDEEGENEDDEEDEDDEDDWTKS